MIVLDIETTGLSPRDNCMVSLGAVHLDTDEYFYAECRIWQGSQIDPIAMKVNGFTEEEVRREGKMTPVELYESFVRWAWNYPKKDHLIGGHNIGHFDILFLEEYHRLANSNQLKQLPWLFGYRTVDLHSLAFQKFGESLSHPNICLKLGLDPEPTPHNALAGARSEAAAFRLLL